MQADINIVAINVAEKTGKSEEYYKALGKFLFKRVMEMTKNPESLVIWIKGFGNWYMRKARMEKTVNRFLYNPEAQNTEKNLKFLRALESRLVDYEEFLTERNRIRQLRKNLFNDNTES